MDLFKIDDLVALNAPTEFAFVHGGGFTVGNTPIVGAESVPSLVDCIKHLGLYIKQSGVNAVEQIRAPRVDRRAAVPITYLEDSGVWSWWQRAKDRMKRTTLTLCCGGHVVDSWDREITFDRAVRHEMLHHTTLRENETVAERVTDIVTEVNGGRVQHVPKLVANVTVALRMKLGLGAMDRSVPGNVALVRAEAARMLREWNVRHLDAAAHLLLIERCFFTDDTHYQITTWRAKQCRESRFVNWILGREAPVAFDF